MQWGSVGPYSPRNKNMDSPKFLILIYCSLRSPRKKITLILCRNWAFLCTNNIIWTQNPIVLILIIEKYFKISSIQKHLAEELITLPLTFDYYSSKPRGSRGKKLHSTKPRGTKKKFIPHLPHSPRNKIW